MTTSQRRAQRLLVPLLAAGIALPALPASATVSINYCDGLSYQHVVKTYSRGAASKPLRCGKSTWGFLHLTSRWNATFDSMIALTIAQGEAVPDFQGDGGSTIYALFDGSCIELFRVIYNGGAYLGTGVSPQGIITAYYRNLKSAWKLRSYVTKRPLSYRQDCDVIQQI